MNDNYIDEDWDVFKKKFNEEVDTIFGEYADFFALPDPDYDFPTDPKEKYELFKDSTGRYQFYEIKWNYLTQAGREDDVNSIKAEIIDIQSITQHEKLNSEIEKLKLFRAAKEYFAKAKVLGPVEGKGASYTEEVTLYIYTLHEMGYFNNYSLPDDAFYIDGTANNIKFLGEVYGKYFLFYDYLLEQAAKHGVEITITIKPEIKVEKKPENPKSKKQQTMDKTLREIWEGSQDEWDCVVLFLQKDNHKDGLPFMTSKKNSEYNWTRVGRRSYQKFLAGFIRVCVEYGYILNEYTGGEMVSICCNTFKNLNGLERNNFTNLHDFSKIDVYQEPFLTIPKKKVKK